MSLNETLTVTDPYIPPVNTGISGTELLIQQIIIVVIISIVFVTLIMWMFKRGRKANDDIDPDLEDLMSDPYNPNTAMLVLLGLLLPTFVGVLAGLQLIYTDVYLGGMVIVGSIFVTLVPFLLLKENSRNKTRNMKKMEGTLYTKNNKKRKYYFANVDFDAERTINDHDRKEVLKVKGMSEEVLDRLHPVPATINKKYSVYFMFESSFADAIAWMNDDEFDYYGSYKTKMDSPVLKEVCKIQRVEKNPDDENDLVNEYVYFFWVMFDDSHAQQRMSGQQLVDLTDNEVFAGIMKGMGADRKVLAGEMNTTTEELAGYKHDDRSFEAKVNNRANAIADGIAADQEALSMLDKLDKGLDLKYWLTILVTFIFGMIFGLYQAGGG